MSDPSQHQREPTLGECVTQALIWEATAAKPGNVHRGADFEDMTFADMTSAAVAIGATFERHTEAPLGELVLAAVNAMRASVDRNTHLGTILLIAPLAVAARRGGSLVDAAEAVVNATTEDDTRLVYEAIRQAKPGGLGEVEQGDIADSPQVSLRQAMKLAAGRDLVARQYATGFSDVFWAADEVAGFKQQDPLQLAIIKTHLVLMMREPDSLIARKCGIEIAKAASVQASRVFDFDDGENPQEERERFLQNVADFDFWLRADGHRRNPGTTADIIGAALFVLLVEGRINWPVSFYG